MKRPPKLLPFMLVVAAFVPGVSLAAQDVGIASTDRAPHFLYSSGPTQKPYLINVASVPSMARRITLNLDGVDRRVALAEIARASGLQLVYSAGVVPNDGSVSVKAQQITVAAALTEVLFDAHVDVVLSAGGTIVLVKRVLPSVPQVGTITGRVIDSTTKEGVGGLIVTVEGTRIGTTTAIDGTFTLRGVPAGQHTIIVRRLGYRSQSRSVSVGDNATATIDFVLVRAPTVLSEVVSTATGDRPRIELGNAIGTIKADSIVQTTLIRNMSDLLTARTPSVIVSNISGAVGAPSKVRIRGINSIQLNNDPIVIIDGVRMAAQMTSARSQTVTGPSAAGSSVQLPTVALPFGTISGGGSSFSTAAPSRFDDIDPNTIESIDVLRGPSAASLYGTEAANGVIVIKTKKGVQGPMRLNILADQGWSHIAGEMPLGWIGWGRSVVGSIPSTCPLFGKWTDPGSSVTNGACFQDSVTAYSASNDPYLTTLGNGSTRNLSASLSGGLGQLQQYLSMRYSDDVGIAKMSDAERNRLARTWGSPPPSWMRRPNTETDMNGTSTSTLRLGPAFDMSINLNGVYRDVLGGQIGVPASRPGGGTFGFLSARGHWDTLAYLPSEMQKTKISSTAKRGYGSTTANYNPLSWLKLRAILGADYTLRVDDGINRGLDCTLALGANGVCTSGHVNYRGETLITTADIGAQFRFPVRDWLTLRTSIGEQYSRTRFTGVTARNANGTSLAFGTELLTPAPIVTTTGIVQFFDIIETKDQSATAGWSIEQMVSLRERLFITGALRQDAASAFGPSINAKAPVYPKLGLSWLLSDEPLFPRATFVTNLRLRAAYGHSGNQAAQTDILKNYVLGQGVATDGSTAVAIAMSGIGNAVLKPERTTEWEAGFDLSLFGNDRVTIEATKYRKLSRDAILPITHPPSLGIGNGVAIANSFGANLGQRVNLGSVENKGTEVAVTGRILDLRNLGWEATVNYAQNKNTLVKRDKRLADFSNTAQFKAGYPVFARFGYRITSYADKNGDGLLGFNDVVWTDTTVFFGAPYPKSELTWLNSVTLLRGSVRVNTTLDQINGFSQTMNVFAGASHVVGARGWSDPTAPLSMQAKAMQALRNGAFMDQTSALRLSELSVTYTASSAWANRLFKARSASITFAGRNLGLWTNYASKDPNLDTSWMTNAFNDVTDDNGSGLPQPRNWTFRLSLGL